MFKVTNNQKITPQVILLTLENVSGKQFTFKAGQYAALNFQHRGRPSPVRCFSIVSSPTNSDVIQFAIKVNGDYSMHLSQLECGETVFVQGPFGSFVLDSERNQNVVMLAAGIGITPMLSMIREVHASKLDTKVTLLYTARATEDMAFSKELIELNDVHKQIRTIFVLSGTISPKLKGAKVIGGRIDKALLRRVVTQAPANTVYLICGPPKFMDDVSSALVQQGIHEDSLMLEAFGQRGMGGIRNKEVAPKRIYFASAFSLLVAVGVFVISSILGNTQATASKANSVTTTTATKTHTTSATTSSSATASSKTKAAATTPTTTTTTTQSATSSVS